MDKNVLKIEDVKKMIPLRIKESHKGTYGKVCLLGGSFEYSGAIRLAYIALTALRSGCGMVTVATPSHIAKIVASHILEEMIYPLDVKKINDENYNDITKYELIFNKNNIDNLINKMDVIACGMGLGKSNGSKEIVNYIINNFDKKLLLDADAINIVSENTDCLLNKKAKIILTPHNIEFKRLLLGMKEKIIADDEIDFSINDFDKKVILAQKFAKYYNVVILLKGTTTIVTDGLNTRLIDKGTPGMATAGSGDVLSGICAGFLGYIDNILDAITVSAFVNGMAGEEAEKEVGSISMISGDTARCIPKAIKYILE